MKKIKFLKITTLLIATMFFSPKKSSSQNFAINKTGTPGDPSAVLDVSADSLGFLIPRVALTSTTDVSTIKGAPYPNSLLIYNTNTINDVSPGYYYWDGSKWVRLFDANFSQDKDWTVDADTLYSYPDSTLVIKNGNVGIMTTSPTVPLQIRNALFLGETGNVSLGPDIKFHAQGLISSERELFINFDGDQNMGTQALYIGTGAHNSSATNLVTILDNGNVGIGTTAPNYQLELSLDSAAKPSSSTWTVLSDERLKNITGRYQKGLKEILQLNPITYYYKNNKDSLFDPRVLKKENIGFTAQSVAKIFPEAVDTASNGYLGLNIHPILIAYVNAIKELKAENDALKNAIEALKDKYNKEIAEIKAMLGMKAEK